MDTVIKNTIGIKDWLWNFAVITVLEYKMDDSHGMQHFVNTVLYTRIILEEFADKIIIPGYTKEKEIEIITDAAFVHDLIDHKYIPEEEACAFMHRV